MVVEAQKHLMYFRQFSKGPPMAVTYEHIRLALTNSLAQDMMNISPD